MKAFVLAKIAKKLKTYKFIKKALRVDENLILLQFDNDRFYFDLTKGNSMVYKKHHNENIKKDFNAPFDILLAKDLSHLRLQMFICSMMIRY